MQALAKHMEVTLFGFEGAKNVTSTFLRAESAENSLVARNRISTTAIRNQASIKFSLLTFLFTRK